jgi:cytochrome b561
MTSTSQHYTRTAQMLHWLMAVIFIAAWLIGFYSGNFLAMMLMAALKAKSSAYIKTSRQRLSFWS